jgi:hypothetical protein
MRWLEDWAAAQVYAFASVDYPGAVIFQVYDSDGTTQRTTGGTAPVGGPVYGRSRSLCRAPDEVSTDDATRRD